MASPPHPAAAGTNTEGRYAEPRTGAQQMAKATDLHSDLGA